MKISDRAKTPLILLGLTLLCLILFQFGNGAISLTDPDDVFYADTAKEMLSHHSWLTPIMFGQPQFEKPPLYYWLLMFSFQLFGVTAVAARLVGVIAGIASVLGTFLFVRKLAGQRTAVLAAVILASSIWWIGLARVVLTDLVFSVLIMFSLYSFLAWYSDRRSRWLAWFALCTGLATLAKSPLGLLLPLMVIVIFLLVEKDWTSLRRFLASYWWILYAAISVPWYWYCTAIYGKAFIGEFFVHDHWDRLIMAEHADFNHWYFYLAAVAFGFIPWTPYLPAIFRGFAGRRRSARFGLIWILAMGLFFTLAQSKLTTYIAPIYPALAILVAMGIDAGFSKRLRITSGLVMGILALGLAAGATVLASRFPDFGYPALISFGTLAGILIVSAILLFMNRVMLSVAVSATGIAAFSLLAGSLVFGRLEGGLTQTNLIPLVAQYNYGGKTILCSKLYTRGIYFYTENPVAVISTNQQPFWSNHPVPIISADSQVAQFVQSRDTLMAVVSRGDLERISRNLAEGETVDTLAHDMDKIVVLCLRRPRAAEPTTGQIQVPLQSR